MGTITTYNLRHIRLIQVSLSKAQCDSYRCERLKVSASGGIVLDGYYPAGALSVEEHPGDAAEVYACYYDDYTFLGSRASLPEYKFVKPEGFSDAAVSAPAGRAGSGLNDRTVSLTWDEAGRLKSDPTRNISNISYNSLGLPERTRYSNGDFLTCSYDGFGRKLSAEYSQTSINTTTKQRREYYAGGLVVCDDSVETVRFAGGYFDSKLKPKYYITDYQGNNVAVADSSGLRKQNVWYYPYGEPLRRPSATFSLSSTNRYLFGDKEYSNFNGESQYDFGQRIQSSSVTPIFYTHDPLCYKRPWESPFIYCGGNPVMAIDPTGCDTINVIRGKNKIWEKPVVIFAKGDDVINVTDGENTSTHIFSEGEYGNRVIALNLEIKKAESSYTFGIYHVSGCNDSATGFYVTPGGEASNKKKSKRRTVEGVYPIDRPAPGVDWRRPGLGGSIADRGVRFHYGIGNARVWTDGCFVLFYTYELKNGKVMITKEDSLKAANNFDEALGATGHYKYPVYDDNDNLKGTRIGSTFPNPITHKLILKSR